MTRPPQPLLSALQELSQGKPFPWAWLATWDAQRGAQVRTVRLLAYNWLQGTATFASHADHAKHKQILTDPRGQLCLLREQPLIQVRLDVKLRSQPGEHHPHGDRLWQKLSAADKVQLYREHPQRPTMPATFWLVEAQLESAEVLRLGTDGSRVRYVKSGPSWTTKNLPG